MATQRRGDGQTALVTGASMGIGVDLAECFASDGYNLILSARSKSALDAVAARLIKTYGIEAHAIPADLSLHGGGKTLGQAIAAAGLTVDVLVNNAGYGKAGAFEGSDMEIQLGMIDLNVRALVELTHIYWPGMIARGKGGVLNVASTAAFQPGPLMAIYYASKAFVLSFSEALWEEARGTGVNVSCLCPGPTVSEFRGRAGTGATRLGKTVKVMASAPVAKEAYDGFVSNRRVVVTGVSNLLMSQLVSFVPRRMLLRFVRRLQSPA